MVKLVRLVANLATDEKHIVTVLANIKGPVQEFMSKLCSAIERKKIEISGEFLLNAISCTTNLLFFDTPSAPLFDDAIRTRLFHLITPFLLET